METISVSCAPLCSFLSHFAEPTSTTVGLSANTRRDASQAYYCSAKGEKTGLRVAGIGIVKGWSKLC